MDDINQSKLIFIAGVHGVGKSTFCRELEEQVGGISVSASSLIKRGTKLNKNKIVDNLESNQTILLNELAKERSREPLVLLDGHFCVFGQNYSIEKIPLETFKAIAPSRIIVLFDDIRIIINRINDRDQQNHAEKNLISLQNEELKWASIVSNELRIPILKTKPIASKTMEDFIKG